MRTARLAQKTEIKGVVVLCHLTEGGSEDSQRFHSVRLAISIAIHSSPDCFWCRQHRSEGSKVDVP
jgi:hypothetical protein